MSLSSIPNPDLAIVSDNKPRWNTPDHRRTGFQNLHSITRYGISLRSDEVLTLTRAIDPRIGDIAEVQVLTATEVFCAMVILRGQDVLFEKYASDFSADHPHTIMSISKTTMNLVIGRLVADGKIDVTAKVSSYLPDIGTGYAEATVQQVLNMDLENEYTEDYTDPFASAFLHEAAIGWRLPGEDQPEHQTQKEFLAALKSDGAVIVCNQVEDRTADAVLAELREPFDAVGRCDEGEFNGYKTLRVSGILAVSPASADLVAHPRVLS